ncbi:hypothetical protein CRUP_035994 [Coryphaenoides rupestris]|nr:hypothetical protein CRUP_035994 [Coryphaenoides rupestris]
MHSQESSTDLPWRNRAQTSSGSTTALQPRWRWVSDATGQQMLSSMWELAQRAHGGRDCVACVVLSHGAPGCVYGVDGKQVLLTELTEPLSGSCCASLRGKPKLVFIQACPGQCHTAGLLRRGPTDPAPPPPPLPPALLLLCPRHHLHRRCPLG